MPETLMFFSLADVERMFLRTSRVWLATEALFKAGAPWVRLRMDAPLNGTEPTSTRAFAIETPWDP